MFPVYRVKKATEKSDDWYFDCLCCFGYEDREGIVKIQLGLGRAQALVHQNADGYWIEQHNDGESPVRGKYAYLMDAVFHAVAANMGTDPNALAAGWIEMMLDGLAAHVAEESEE